MRRLFIALLLIGAFASLGAVACGPGGGQPAASGAPGY